jgi:hypothetical protein
LKFKFRRAFPWVLPPKFQDAAGGSQWRMNTTTTSYLIRRTLTLMPCLSRPSAAHPASTRRHRAAALQPTHAREHSQLQPLPRCRHLRQRDWFARSVCAGCATAVTGRRVGQSILGHTHRHVHPRRARSQAKRSRRDGPSPRVRGNTIRCPLVPPFAPTLGMGSAGAGTGRVAQSARPGRPG